MRKMNRVQNDFLRISSNCCQVEEDFDITRTLVPPVIAVDSDAEPLRPHVVAAPAPAAPGAPGVQVPRRR